MSCEARDRQAEHWTALRLLAVGLIVMWRMYGKLDLRGLSCTQCLSACFGCLYDWVHREGLGMSVYFGTAFILDMTMIFKTANPAGSCETDKLVAMYSAAVLSFLPNVLFCHYLQGPLYEAEGQTPRNRMLFLLGAFGIAVLSFIVRSLCVYHLGWLSYVSAFLHGFPEQKQVLSAVLTPPLVDALQSFVLVFQHAGNSSSHYRDLQGSDDCELEDKCQSTTAHAPR